MAKPFVVERTATDYGQCNIPVLLEGEAYLQVSAGLHTMLLRNDGCVLSCGSTYDIL